MLVYEPIFITPLSAYFITAPTGVIHCKRFSGTIYVLINNNT